MLCQQPAEGLRKSRTGSEHNEPTQNNQPPAQVVTGDLLSHALEQPCSVSLPQMPPAHFQAHISFSHPPRGDDFHSLLPACRKKYLLLSLHTSSATSRSGMKKNLNSHSPSTLFMAVSMFITPLLNHPFARVELSSVHPLCTWKVFFSPSDHHLHSPSLYLFQFLETGSTFQTQQSMDVYSSMMESLFSPVFLLNKS